MRLAIALAIVSSGLVAFIATAVLVRLGTRASAFDGQGVDGQTKAAPRRVPNIGGIGLSLGVLLPLGTAGALAFTNQFGNRFVNEDLAKGLADSWQTGVLAVFGLLAIHILGLIDDRRPLSWAPKLAAMILIPAAVAWLTDTRLLSAADPIVGGAWLSIAATSLWFAVVMNAMNFMDNMDGLTAGVTSVISACVVGIALIGEQWLVAGAASCLLGATLGFLPHNFPRARIFMGDGGSLVLGYCLAFLTVRLTYVDSNALEPRWDRLVIPFVLLAVPLYDMLSVVVIRMSQRRSPFLGDLQHLSHRFEGRGLSRPVVAASVWVLTLVTGLGAVVLAEGSPRQSVLIGVQTIAALMLLAVVEHFMRWRSE